MVYNYPFFNFPRARRNNFYYNKPPYFNNTSIPNFNNTSIPSSYSSSSYNNVNKMPLKNFNEAQNSKTSSKEEEVNNDAFFEIFGLKLYFDDVLIICLIWFLYQEGVKDEYLFMALILLLLS